VTFIDRVGYMLHKIADHALCAKDKIDSENVKGMWLEAILKKSYELPLLNNLPKLDLLGRPEFSVFQHLENHSSVDVVSKCLCGTFHHKDYFFDVRSIEQIEILGTPSRLNEAKMPFCLKCNHLRVLLDLIPIRNWLLIFNCHLEFRPLSPLLNDIPKILQVGSDMFKLEYVSYVQDGPTPLIKHEVSLQFIRHSWYVFDSDHSPKFFRFVLPVYKYKNAVITNLVYFKI